MKQVIGWQDVFVEAHIADLHFGTIDPEKEFKILNEQFLNYLELMNVLDIVTIEGDLFDHKFMASSEAVIYAIQFVQRLIEICRRKRAAIILISGTGSHDSDQLKLFTPFLNSGCEMHIVFKTEFIFVKGKKILCIPELYNMGKKYYEQFLVHGGLYDACYMHGTFKGSIIGKNERDLDSNREPVFDIEDFDNCKGPIISGHVHVHNVYKQHFYYCGSPIRYRYGEEEPKGFMILLHNIQTKKYLLHFEEIQSFRYDTINLDHLLDQDPRVIVNYIKTLNDQGIDHIRIVFTKNSKSIELIKNYYRSRSDIKVETRFEEQKIKERLEEMDNEYQQYDYLFDGNLSPEQKLIQYINQEEKTEYWTLDSFNEFLHYIEKL